MKSTTWAKDFAIAPSSPADTPPSKSLAPTPESTRTPLTTFVAGDRCLSVFEQEYAEVIVWCGYGVHWVSCQDGLFFQATGYLVQGPGSEELYFRAAGDLLDLQNGIRHMAVVR